MFSNFAITTTCEVSDIRRPVSTPHGLTVPHAICIRHDGNGLDNESEMERRSNGRTFPFHRIATIYSGLGHEGKALDLLERSIEGRKTRLMDIKIENAWDNLLSDPRSPNIVRTMNFGD
jgi:hypothetical protein